MIKTLGKQIKEFSGPSILTPLCMLAEVIVENFIPLLMAVIIDSIGTGDLKKIYITAAIMLFLAVAGLVAGIGGGVFGAKASTGFAKNLRKAMFQNIQTFSFSNIDKFSTAGLVTRLTTDVTNMQNAYQMILRMAVRAPFSLLVAMIMAFTVSPKMASIYLIAVIILGMILALITTKAYKYFSQVFKKYDALNESVQENVTAMRVVKAYVREDYERGKFGKASYNVYKMFIKAEGIVSLNAPIMMTTVYTCILLISWLSAQAIVAGGNMAPGLTTGNLTSLLAYCMNILMSLMMLSMVFVMITMCLSSGKRIAEVLEEKADIVNPENPDYNVPDGSITFKNVNFRYNRTSEKPVLENINIHIKSGETIGIMGGTGSAKSSFVNLISRLYDIEPPKDEETESYLLVGGKDVKTYDLDTLRKEVSVVLQKNVLFSGSILENLRWGDSNASEEECIRACKLACADEFIEQMPDKYNTHIEQGGANVSGGQKQRLCIARALLKKPKILILDDSTSAVDTLTDSKIRKAFREEIPDTTKIIIAQRISSIMDADRIIVLDDGKIDGIGTHEELLENNEIYREVYSQQTNDNADFDREGGEA
ncbi:ABC transporter ATP-binding protein [uncultured Eubacterium sp.]|uniref:ABC transporter ATP-binding protein n=1 Tax=uncultured Eubacterium sp. TaxID=165185 RepID=UPI0026716CC7|nr:ABC transporter ATP-binding protein [uncultured Eubacterium sp.]